MKKAILKLLGRYLGLNKLLSLVDGKKAYIGGAGLVLVGLGMLAGEVAIAAQDSAALLELLSRLPQHPGTVKILEGLGVLGLRHALDKK